MKDTARIESMVNGIADAAESFADSLRTLLKKPKRKVEEPEDEDDEDDDADEDEDEDEDDEEPESKDAEEDADEEDDEDEDEDDDDEEDDDEDEDAVSDKTEFAPDMEHTDVHTKAARRIIKSLRNDGMTGEEAFTELRSTLVPIHNIDNARDLKMPSKYSKDGESTIWETMEGLITRMVDDDGKGHDPGEPYFHSKQPACCGVVLAGSDENPKIGECDVCSKKYKVNDTKKTIRNVRSSSEPEEEETPTKVPAAKASSKKEKVAVAPKKASKHPKGRRKARKASK